MSKRSFCLLFSLLFSTVFFCKAQSQNTDFPYELGLNIGKGFIISHSPTMEFITHQHIEKAEIYLQKSTFGKNQWETQYGLPRMGASFTYFSLNNERHLGDAYALAPYLNFGLFESNRFRLGLRTGLGFGWIEKPFDVESNSKNTAIGSKLNLYFSIALRSELKISKQVGLGLGLNFSHFSNTSFKKPNKGINIPSVETGLYYRFGKQEEIKSDKDFTGFKSQKAHWRITGGAGLNKTSITDERSFLAVALSVSREKRLGFKSSIGANLDFFQNPGRRKDLEADSIFIDKGFKNTQIGISFYHLLHIGKLGVIAQAGYYLKSEDESLGRIYHLAGGRVQLDRNWSIYFALKTHFARAEYFLLGISYQMGS